MRNKIEDLHEERLRGWLEYNFDPLLELNDEIIDLEKQKTQCQEELNQLRVTIDRVPYFENVLNESLKDNEITENRKESLIAYIKAGVDSKKPATDYFKFTSELFWEFRMFLPSQNSAIWNKITDICKEIDRIEDNEFTLSGKKDESKKLQSKLDNISDSLELLDEKSEIEDEEIRRLFMTEDSLSIDELNALCRNASSKTELLLIRSESPIDSGLAAVIQMRAKSARDKGNNLVVLSLERFNELIQDNQVVNGVTKLSFLHHGPMGVGYKDKISDYINHLPDLKEIVLRGCGTANEPIINKQPIYEAKVANVPYDKKPPIQGVTQLIIQQKEDEDGKIFTKVSWRTLDPETNKSNFHEVDIPNLPKITKEKPSDEQLTALERDPRIPLLMHSHAYVSSLKTSFFNKNQKISYQELINTKKAVRRTRTEPGPSQNDLLSEILSNMTPDQKAKISVKAYVGGYEVHHGRVIPMLSHDQDNLPKAVLVGPSLK